MTEFKASITETPNNIIAQWKSGVGYSNYDYIRVKNPYELDVLITELRQALDNFKDKKGQLEKRNKVISDKAHSYVQDNVAIYKDLDKDIKEVIKAQMEKAFKRGANWALVKRP